jgi:hypothetical protein
MHHILYIPRNTKRLPSLPRVLFIDLYKITNRVTPHQVGVYKLALVIQSLQPDAARGTMDSPKLESAWYLKTEKVPGALFTMPTCVSDITFGKFDIRNTCNFVNQ